MSLTLAYFATGWLGLQMPFTDAHITLVWLPTGIAVAALLLWGRRAWPCIFVGAFLVNLVVGSSGLLAAGIAVGNTLGPLLTVRWLRGAGFEPAFSRQSDVGAMVVAAGLGMAVSATLGVINLHLAGALSTASLGTAWLSWWMGDTVGVLLIGPLLLTLTRKNLEQLGRNPWALAGWVIVACPVMWLVFLHDFDSVERTLPLAFLTFPLFAWAALRSGVTGAAIAGLAFSLVAAWGTSTGHGTFSLPDSRVSMFLLWSYMASTVITGLLITALQAERRLAEEMATNLALYDPLTQLPNRRMLMDRLAQALISSERSRRRGALLLIDLDNFKTINDTLGHDQGDLLLQQVGQRLKSCVRVGDIVARLGGDEFVVILELLSDIPEVAASQTELVGSKILAALGQPYQLTGSSNRSTPSIGITLFVGQQNTVDELLKQADLAMYQAKAAGRNALRFFDQTMQAVAIERAALETGLRDALRERQFVLYFQPQVSGANRLIGAEALVRWHHPQRGMVSPAEFIPMAEETGLILPLGLWVLEAACEQLVIWASESNTDHLTLAVNVSANQMHQPDFVEQVIATLEKTGANPQRLKLELTESLLVSDVETTIAKMTSLKTYGVGFALDDFGTGYSSLSYLKRLPLYQLKIDQSFIRDILSDANDAAIAKMVIALGESMGLAVIAEGVESEAQRESLAQMGCHAYQGYLFSRPVPISEFEKIACEPVGLNEV